MSKTLSKAKSTSSTNKYDKLPTKLDITNPWKALCVYTIGPFTIKRQDSSVIDFLCLAMIDPATSWFKL